MPEVKLPESGQVHIRKKHPNFCKVVRREPTPELHPQVNNVDRGERGLY